MKKEEVIALLVSQEKPQHLYGELVKAYQMSKNPNRLFLSNVQRNIYTKSNYDTLVYELKKQYNIKNIEIYKASADALPPKDTIKPPKPFGFQGLENETETLKLREEFKRLNTEDVPDIVHIAVGKKMNTYHKMQELTKKLHELNEEGSEDQELLTSIGKELVESTEENDLLYQELKHWDETGEFLGQHDLFWQTPINKEVDAMNGTQLAKEIEASRKFIEKNEKLLLDESLLEEKRVEIQEKIERRIYKKEFAEKKLAAK